MSTARTGTPEPLPADYEVVRTNGLRALYRDSRRVSVFSADGSAAPAATAGGMP